MPVKKHNKAELWKSFLESEYLSVQAWGKESGFTAKKNKNRLLKGIESITKGWGVKKETFLKKAIVKFEEKFSTELERNWSKAMKNASMAEMKIINDMAAVIHSGATPRNTQDFERVFKMFRLVLGKSTNNNQNTNANLNIPLAEDEEKKIGEIISRNNAFYNRPGLETFEGEKNED